MLTIKQRQMNLMFLNYNCGCRTMYVPDGIEGKQTKNAYYCFQRDFDLVPNGIYEEKTDKKLKSIIESIQALIGADVDGVVGTQTIKKLMEYQGRKNLTQDGICGTKTRNELFNFSNLTWNDIVYFNPYEMDCKCGCGLNNTNLELMKVADKIREHFGKPMIITSGCRCSEHNKNVGGVQGSRHVLGKAIDFYIQGVSTQDVLSYCNELQNRSIIRYCYTNNANMKGVVHIDIL